MAKIKLQTKSNCVPVDDHSTNGKNIRWPTLIKKITSDMEVEAKKETIVRCIVLKGHFMITTVKHTLYPLTNVGKCVIGFRFRSHKQQQQQKYNNDEF